MYIWYFYYFIKDLFLEGEREREWENTSRELLWHLWSCGVGSGTSCVHVLTFCYWATSAVPSETSASTFSLFPLPPWRHWNLLPTWFHCSCGLFFSPQTGRKMEGDRGETPQQCFTAQETSPLCNATCDQGLKHSPLTCGKVCVLLGKPSLGIHHVPFLPTVFTWCE